MNEWDTEYRNLLAQWSKALVITTLNQRLYDSLTHGTYQLLKYSKDNNIPLPDTDKLIKNIQESREIMDRMLDQETFGNNKNNP